MTLPLLAQEGRGATPLAGSRAGQAPPRAVAVAPRWQDWLDRHLGAFFLAPGLLCLTAVVAYPILYNLVVSFTDRSLIYPGAAFVGLDNYRAVVADGLFWRSLARSAAWTALSVAGQLLLGLVGALALERVTRGRGIWRTLLIVPWAVPSVVMAFGWRFMLDPLYGVLNPLLMGIGIIGHPVAWFGDAATAFGAVTLMTVWFGFPFMMVALAAGMQAIPPELYEAARVDGASWWQELRGITLPSLRRVIGTVVLLRTVWVFNNFDFVFLSTGGGPAERTTTLPVLAYRTGWQQFDLGGMSAMAIVMIVLLGAAAVLSFRLVPLDAAGEEA